MEGKRFKRAIISALQHVSERCAAWGKTLDKKSAELQARIDRWSKRMEEKNDK